MIKLRHERMLILRCILPQKTELPPEKSHWEYLNRMTNLKLLAKYQPPPSHHQKKENLNLQENEKTSLLVKVSTTLKLPQPL